MKKNIWLAIVAAALSLNVVSAFATDANKEETTEVVSTTKEESPAPADAPVAEASKGCGCTR